MTDSTPHSWADWIGATVVDEDGDKIGSLEQIYVDRSSDQPEWLLVKTGLFGNKSTFVPLEGSSADGEDLRVPYAKALVKDAPNVDEDEEGLSGEEEQRLYAHYGRDHQPQEDGDQETGQQNVRETGDQAGTETMTRSEEELAVGTRSVESGKVRLRKYVVTENVTTTVPIRREKVRMERVPIEEGDSAASADGATIGEEEQVVTLHEEEPVVSKKTVAKEQVRIGKDVETSEETVLGEVRKEQIELDEDA